MYANRYTIGNHSRDDGVECGLELEAVSVVQSMSIMLLDGFSLTAPAAILIWQRNSRNSSKNDRHNNNNKFTFQFDIFLHKSRFFSREGLRLSSVTKPIRDPTRIYNFCRQLDQRFQLFYQIFKIYSKGSDESKASLKTEKIILESAGNSVTAPILALSRSLFKTGLSSRFALSEVVTKRG